MIPFFQQFSGINALIYYSPTLFETMGFDLNIQLIMSGVLNSLQLVGCTSTVWTMDTLGRRKLLFAGSVSETISHIIIAALVGRYSSNWASHQTAGWVSAAFLLVYMVALGAAWGPVGLAIPSGMLTCPILQLVYSHLIRRFIRDLPFFSPRQGRRHRHVLKLAEQLHHRAYHAAAHRGDGIRHLRLLRRLLWPLWYLDVLFRGRRWGARSSRWTMFLEMT